MKTHPNAVVQLIVVMLLLFSTSVYAQSDIAYKEGDTALKGYLVKAKAGKSAPGIVIVPAWMGITEHEKGSADKLAALGYNAFVADIYGEGNKPANKQEAGKLAGYYKSHIEDYQRRVKLSIDALVKQGADPARIVVMGYCFGGTGAIEAARAGFPVKGVVSFHGGLSKDTLRKDSDIVAKVLVLHGADDPYVKTAEILRFQDEMRNSKADWQMIYYANAVHAFTEVTAGSDNAKGAAYNEEADKRSWQHLLLFLDELFKK